MNNFNRWLRSKSGIATIVGIVGVALVVAILGQFAGWWGGPGTAGLPPVEQSCMPSCDETDARMLTLIGSGLQSFADTNTALWISVPKDNASFTLSVFDGDSGKDGVSGHWDTSSAETTYTLYVDSARDGSTSQVVGQWSSNDMPDNAWFDIQVDNVPEAAGDNSDYYYRFVASVEPAARSKNGFKVKTQNAYLSVGKSSQAGTPFGMIGGLNNMTDLSIVYPEFNAANYPEMGPSTYSGIWEFQFYLPDGQNSIEIWNGDADRGTSALPAYPDTDDLNTSGKPAWAGSAAIDERAAGKGAPADDYSVAIFRREPSIQFVVIGPDGSEIARDTDPGGTEEWERFLVSTDPNDGADVVVGSLPAGNYKLRIEGVDLDNALWLDTNLELFSTECTENCCLPGDPDCGGMCVPENSNLGGGYAIIALNPGSCQGQQNGLLFHGTSYTLLYGKAISNGCLRSVGTHTVESSGVEFVGQYDNKNSKVKIIPDPYQVSTPVSVDVAAPNCSDPAAHQMNGKDFKGEVNLEPGLYCITGDVTINAGDVVKGDDVTLYFMNGKLTINGGSTVQLSAPYAPGVDVSPALSNILFYVPSAVDKKGNVSGQPVTINGNADSRFSGTLYAPGSAVDFLGTSYTEGTNVTQIIGWDVRVGGTADLILGYVGSNDPVCEIK